MTTAALRGGEPARLSRFSRLTWLLNTSWHQRALLVFAAITLSHWAEHVVQAVQVWVFHHPRPESRGVLGEFFPVLVSSEALHYAYALVMLAGLALLLPGFSGRSRSFWLIALGIQVWHHLEHLLLLGQAQTETNLFGGAVPTSVLQAVFPKSRVEIHLVYNALVTIPMVAAMILHKYPSQDEPATGLCTCRVAVAA